MDGFSSSNSSSDSSFLFFRFLFLSRCSSATLPAGCHGSLFGDLPLPSRPSSRHGLTASGRFPRRLFLLFLFFLFLLSFLVVDGFNFLTTSTTACWFFNAAAVALPPSSSSMRIYRSHAFTIRRIFHVFVFLACFFLLYLVCAAFSMLRTLQGPCDDLPSSKSIRPS